MFRKAGVAKTGGSKFNAFVENLLDSEGLTPQQKRAVAKRLTGETHNAVVGREGRYKPHIRPSRTRKQSQGPRRSLAQIKAQTSGFARPQCPGYIHGKDIGKEKNRFQTLLERRAMNLGDGDGNGDGDSDGQNVGASEKLLSRRRRHAKDMITSPAPKSLEDQILEEIDERSSFLEEMRSLGSSRAVEHRIQSEIQSRLEQLDRIQKSKK